MDVRAAVFDDDDRILMVSWLRRDGDPESGGDKSTARAPNQRPPSSHQSR